MVQVDVFWAYGIGAGFALAAAHQLRGMPIRSVKKTADAADEATPRTLEEGWPANSYLTGAVLFCAAVFAPSGAWLLWSFPNWETMQAGDFTTVPGWLVAGFAATNTTQGLAGFLVTWWLIRRGRITWAALQVVGGYFGMFFILVHGWDGTGYQRFFSTDRADFEDWDSATPLAQVGEWAVSDVAFTLYGMGVVMIPLMLFIMDRWHRRGMRTAGAEAPSRVVVAILALGAVGAALVAAIIGSVLIHLLGPILGIPVGLVLLWGVVIRKNGLASWVVRHLGLPEEEPEQAGVEHARQDSNLPSSD